MRQTVARWISGGIFAAFGIGCFLTAIPSEAGQKVRPSVKPSPSPTPKAKRPRRRKPIVPAIEPEASPSPRPSPSPSATPRPAASPAGRAIPEAGAFGPGTLLANLQSPFINESSGVAASRRNPGVFWTHNDSGDGAYLYAFDRTGKTVGVFLARTAFACDWEDIAWGPGPDGKGNYIYISDTGDYPKTRTDACIYRVPEPLLSSESRIGTKSRPRLTDEPTVRLAFSYPDGPHDAESLLVHPKTGDIYLVTKEDKGESGVYKFPPTKPTDSIYTRYPLIKIGILSFSEQGLHPFPNRVTGGDIAPDGKRLVLRTYFAAYEWRLPDGERDFDKIWATKPALITLPYQPQGEGICYTPDGRALILTSEKTPTGVFELKAQ